MGGRGRSRYCAPGTGTAACLPPLKKLWRDKRQETETGTDTGTDPRLGDWTGWLV
jgi:hypothetical protein